MENIDNAKKNDSTKIKKSIKAYVMVVLGTLVYSFGIVWVMQLTGIISSGVTGVSQLIVGILKKFTSVGNAETYLGYIIMLINIPLIIFGWRGVSKNFAILTIVSVVVQTLVITLLTNFTVSPLIYVLGNDSFSSIEGVIDLIKSSNIHIFVSGAEAQALKDAFMASATTGTKLMLAIVGGLVTGGGISIALKYGGSTGGMDIVANYFTTKKMVNFTKIPSIVDGITIALSSLISIEGTFLAIIRLVISVKTIDQMYSSYKTTKLEIVTVKADEIRERLLKEFTHSMTIIDAIGGYTQKEKKVIEIFVSKYEVQEYISIVKSIDPDSFISTTKVKLLKSRFIQRTMI